MNGCITVLQDEQKGLERLHSGFASCTKGHEVTSFAWKFCTMTVLHVYKKALKLVQGVLRRVQKGLEVSSRGFARVQKGLEVGSRDLASCTKGL